MDRRGQIAPFMVMVIAVLILAIAATMLIGELSYSRIRLANATDGALISATSRICQSMNQVRPIHNQMVVNSIAAQVAVARLYSDIGTAYAWAALKAAPLITSNYQLFQQAKDVVKGAGENMRKSLYDSIFGSGLVDEPKPFSESKGDIVLDEEGRVIEIDYDNYNKRDSHFTESYREFKEDPNWYRSNVISYSWNKKVDAATGKLVEGRFNSGEPFPGFQSYLKVTLIDMPQNITVKSKKFGYFFLFCQPCCIPCCFWPGVIYNHWAWISKINIDKKSFGIDVEQGILYSEMPFFSRLFRDQQGRLEHAKIIHKSRVKIQGGLSSGYSFRLEPAPR